MTVKNIYWKKSVDGHQYTLCGVESFSTTVTYVPPQHGWTVVVCRLPSGEKLYQNGFLTGSDGQKAAIVVLRKHLASIPEENLAILKGLDALDTPPTETKMKVSDNVLLNLRLRLDTIINEAVPAQLQTLNTCKTEFYQAETKYGYKKRRMKQAEEILKQLYKEEDELKELLKKLDKEK